MLQTTGLNVAIYGRCCMVFILLIFVADPTALAESECGSKKFDEFSVVRYVQDGDTLNLSDGRKIRLIGINTPELERDNKPAQYYANEAKQALKSLFIKEKSIALVYGIDKKDRYGRLLAHAFLADGQNVQAILLKQGFASAITVPPNTEFMSCYLEMERFARCNNRGLWKSGNILEAKYLKPRDTGFHLVKGGLEGLNSNSKGIWLDVDHKLTIGIRPGDQARFDLEMLKTMLHQTIIVRGWLNENNRETPFYLRLRHPQSLQLFSTFSCAES